MLRHAGAALVFAGFAILYSFPLLRHLSTHLPGTGIGDNVDFLWNFWWMRTALSSGLDVFHTQYLFVPTGTDLTLHTHTALTAFIGATALRAWPIITAQNVLLLIALCLNGLSAYALTYRLTRDAGAAIVGGLVFAGSPYIAAHLHGHFNLTSAFVLPLFAMVATEAVSGAAGWAIVTGATLAATAYLDYYYLVFEAVLGLLLVGYRGLSWSCRRRSPTRVTRRAIAAIAVLVVLDAMVIVAILLTGGTRAPIGPVRSIRGVFNPLQLLWLLIALALWLWFRPRIDVRRRPGWDARRTSVACAIAIAVFVLAAAPLFSNGLAMVMRGDYVTQRYSWRSAPRGIDIATLVMGNPFQPLWGTAVHRLYGALRIDVIEQAAWLGIVPMILAGAAVRGYMRSRSRDVGLWILLGAVFFVWSLGPHLMAFGINTAMILPQAFLRFVPIVNNARIPGRAMVMVYLALSVLAAFSVAQWQAAGRHRMIGVSLAALLIVFDSLPAPFPLTPVDHPRLYDTLRGLPAPGAVCELPLGIRDGFGEQGRFDDRVMFYQTIHGRPLVGGFVGRIPPSVANAYRTEPLLAALMNLSQEEPGTAQPLPGRQAAGESLRKNRIAFIVMNRATARPGLIEYVENVLPLRLVVQEGDRVLYEVTDRS